MSQPSEPFERQIAEFVDGTLDAFTRRDVEERLLTDAEARLLATHYAHLDAALRDSRKEPAIDFDAFAARLSAAIAEEDEHVAPPIRLLTTPVRSDGHSRWRKRVAFAAAAVIAATGAAVLLTGRGAPLKPSATPGELFVAGPAIESAIEPAETKILIGPSKTLIDRGQTAGLTDELVIKRPSRVVISAGDAPTPSLPDDRLY